MRVLRYLGAHKIAVLIVLVLLVGQAFCDLAIPNLTSNIVDVGIQQSGVEHVATDEMSAETHESVASRLSGDAASLFAESYERAQNGNYVLTSDGRRNISELDSILAKPLAQVYDLESGADDSLDAQLGIAAALKEYNKLGFDLPSMQMAYLVKTGAEMLGIATLGAIFSICVGFVSARTGGKIGRDLRRRLFSKVVSFSDAEINRFSAASLITRGTNDIQLIQNVSFMLLRMVIYAPILAIGGIVMVLYTNADMGWIIVVAVLIVIALIGVLFKLTLPRFKMMQKLIDRVNLVAREMLTGLPVVRAFDRQLFEQQRFDTASSELMRTQLFTNRAMSFMMPSIMLIMNLTTVAIVWFGGLNVSAGTLQTGDLIAFITYAMVIIMGFLMMGMISIMLPRADVAAERVNEVLDTIASIEFVEQSTGESSSHEGVRIEFKDVSFRYDDTSECAIKDVSFVAEAGQTLAIVGATGSGKSTILKLIERFYDVCSGSIEIDGTNIKDIPQTSLRQLFGYVPQKAFLFSGTIDSNVAYSDEGMPEARVQEALQIAQAATFVDDKPEGVNSSIVQGGTNVSGGQRQRLAIARALATNAKAFLFDDSFSALDYKTDAELRAALHANMRGKTCIIVAQRIATVMSSDCIVVLDEGEIVGVGTHDDLMRTCDEYREIARSQLSDAELAMGGDAA